MLRPTFAALRGESTVATAVTLLVCTWFLVAAGAILADPASPYTSRAVPQAGSPAVAEVPGAIPPQAHLTITVEARRG